MKIGAFTGALMHLSERAKHLKLNKKDVDSLNTLIDVHNKINQNINSENRKLKIIIGYVYLTMLTGECSTHEGIIDHISMIFDMDYEDIGNYFSSSISNHRVNEVLKSRGVGIVGLMTSHDVFENGEDVLRNNLEECKKAYLKGFDADKFSKFLDKLLLEIVVTKN